MEAYFANNLYKILQASFRESFSVVMLYQKAEFFTGFRSLESMGLGKILIQKVWGILTPVGQWVLRRKETHKHWEFCMTYASLPPTQ